jgi:hypothetical protein
MKAKRSSTVLLIIGAVMTVGGFITSVVYLFQPWRTCDYDDTPSACAMLPGDAAVLMAAIIATMLGVFAFVGGLIVYLQGRR